MMQYEYSSAVVCHLLSAEVSPTPAGAVSQSCPECDAPMWVPPTAIGAEGLICVECWQRRDAAQHDAEQAMLPPDASPPVGAGAPASVPAPLSTRQRAILLLRLNDGQLVDVINGFLDEKPAYSAALRAAEVAARLPFLSSRLGAIGAYCDPALWPGQLAAFLSTEDDETVQGYADWFRGWLDRFEGRA